MIDELRELCLATEKAVFDWTVNGFHALAEFAMGRAVTCGQAPAHPWGKMGGCGRTDKCVLTRWERNTLPCSPIG